MCSADASSLVRRLLLLGAICCCAGGGTPAAPSSSTNVSVPDACGEEASPFVRVLQYATLQRRMPAGPPYGEDCSAAGDRAVLLRAMEAKPATAALTLVLFVIYGAEYKDQCNWQ